MTGDLRLKIALRLASLWTNPGPLGVCGPIQGHQEFVDQSRANQESVNTPKNMELILEIVQRCKAEGINHSSC